MKQLFLLLALCLSTAASAQTSFGKATLLNRDWKFLRIDTTLNEHEVAGMEHPLFRDGKWTAVNLPHDWSATLPLSPDKASCQGYATGGTAWYRKHFETPEGETVFAYFDGVYCRAKVYINGHLVAERPNGFASFTCNLTPYIRRDGSNVLAVRVDHSQDADTRWYTGSGINRNVWLIAAPATHLAQWGTAYRLTKMNGQKAELEVDVATESETGSAEKGRYQAIVELRNAEGQLVAQGKTAIGGQEKRTLRLSIKKPIAWSLNRPYLYTLTTRLMSEGKETDRSTVNAGLRTLSFTPDKGFALNGQPMKLKGVCLHEDAGALGTAVPKGVWRYRLMQLKSIGVNAIRMSHNPHAPLVYDLCDELGLMIMDEASDEWEFPKRKWLKGWNKGVPGFQGACDFFEEWIDRDVADMVRRDRNHPSVVMWSIGNEVDYPNDPYSHPVLNGSSISQPMYGGYKPDAPKAERIGLIAQRLAAVVRSIDKSRPVTGALAGVVMSNETAYPGAVDVVGYNYTENRYKQDHEQWPDRVIYGSENRHDLPAWQAVKDNDFILGQFLWTGADYLGESGPWPARGSSAGLIDYTSERKTLGWYRAALWSEAPVCHITTSKWPWYGHLSYSPEVGELWNYDKGDTLTVTGYANADTLRLKLNGKTLTQAAQRDHRTGTFVERVAYEPGTLTAEAIKNGRIVASHTLATTGLPVALRMVSQPLFEENELPLAIVTIEAIDDQGRRVTLADNQVTLAVEGPARILALENGDLNDTHNRTAAPAALKRLRLYGGRLVAYVQADSLDKLFPVILTATSPLLRKASAKVFKSGR